MQKSKLKKLIIVIVIITMIPIGLCVSGSNGTLPYVVARISSSIYVAINYPTYDFKFEEAEYAYGFGDYSVRYRDKYGNLHGFMLFPKEFPVFVRYDSIKQHAYLDYPFQSFNNKEYKGYAMIFEMYFPKAYIVN